MLFNLFKLFIQLLFRLENPLGHHQFIFKKLRKHKVKILSSQILVASGSETNNNWTRET